MTGPFRLLVLPPPGHLHHDPWSAIVETAAATPGVAVAVVGTGAVALPPGVLGHELRADPVPAASASAVATWPSEAVAWGRGAGRAVRGLLSSGWTPDAAVVDAGSGVGLFLADLLPEVRQVVRVGVPRVVERAPVVLLPGAPGDDLAATDPTAPTGPTGPARPAQAARPGDLVVTDFALVGAQAVVCPHAGVRATLPSMFASAAVIVSDGVDLGLFRPQDRLEGTREPVVVDLGDDPTDLERLRGLVDRLATSCPGVRLAHAVQDLPAPDRARTYARAAVCVALREVGPRLEEALAAGAVVVTAGDVRGWHTIRHGHDGFLVEADADDAVFEAIDYVVGMRDRFGALRRGARRLAEARFDRTLVARRYLGIAIDAAGGRVPGLDLRAEELPPLG